MIQSSLEIGCLNKKNWKYWW